MSNPPQTDAPIREQPPRRKLFFRLFELVVLLCVLWGTANLFYVVDGAETDYAQPADVIILLGCHVEEGGQISVCIRTRSEHAASLYNSGLASHIIATGAETEKGYGTEASVMTALLEDEGVPAGAIIAENEARNTIQNITNSKAIMQANSWDTAILVTEPSHIKRSTLIARDNGLTVYPSPATGSPNWKGWPTRIYNVGRDTLSLMLYQVKSLLGIKE